VIDSNTRCTSSGGDILPGAIIDVSHVRAAIFPDRRGRFEETTSFRRLVAESR
jgi:hypothetical protein